MTSAQTLSAFERAIAAGDKPFEIIGGMDGKSARVRFTGLFNCEKTLWNAHIMTLEEALQQALDRGIAMPVGARQFIEIGSEDNQGRDIRIGLRVPRIDTATIWKTVTMIRNYKRLHPGRIEWGGAPSDRQPR